MEANRLLLVLDGIALNNAIYRSGHMQASSTINPFFLESINLISGPASVGYGNGAMGGAVVFKTVVPFNTSEGFLLSVLYIIDFRDSPTNIILSKFLKNSRLPRI